MPSSRLIWIATWWALLATPATAAQTPSGDRLLNRLVGRWRMSGQVRGRPAVYDLDASMVLEDRFLQLHMRDINQPPGYEAIVYLGVDSTGSSYVAHWIDVFGAGPSRTLGSGQLKDSSLVVMFSYPDGPFRDTITFDTATGGWRLLMETGKSGGGWTTFADYQVRRR